MTEIAANASQISPRLPVTRDNATWLSNALTAGGGARSGLVELNSSAGHVVELPANISFLSVLGPRYWKPGDGGECRFVFDPPLLAGWGLFGPTQDNYTHVDPGNPRAVNVSYQTEPGNTANITRPRVIPGLPPDAPPYLDGVHLLDQQLNASIQYKFAIVSGPNGPLDEQGLVAPAGDADPGARVSPNPCNFSSIQVWHA